MNKEDKNKKFRRLAEKRVNVILDKVRILSNLSNTQLYSYSDTEVKKVFDTIRDSVKDAEVSFHRGEKESKEKFSFDK